MASRTSRFLFLWRQYTLKEFFLLGCAVLLDVLSKKLPEYLLRSKNYFDYYYFSSIEARRNGRDTIVQFQQQEIRLRRHLSDFIVFEQIFLEHELAPIIEQIKQRKIEVKYILDCGANIGLASIYLSLQLPGVSILAIEPEPENFAYLERNVKSNNLKNIKVVQKGVWSRRTMMEHDAAFCPAKGWAFAIKEAENSTGTVAVDTIENIVKSQGLPYVDYIKIDVEGSEFELMRNLQTWGPVFAQIKIISIEIHEKRGKTNEIENILAFAGFEVIHSGELLIGFRNT